MGPSIGTVLIADDEPAIRRLVSAVAESMGFETITVTNGAEAISALTANPNRIDIVVTDIVMPLADGMEVIRHAQQKHPDCHVICMSANVDYTMPDGVQFLAKPFQLHDLCQLLADASFARRNRQS